MSAPDSREIVSPRFTEIYLPGLLQLAPVELDLDEGVNNRDVLIEPSYSKEHLDFIECSEEKWLEILDARGQSHEIRALIISALGKRIRSLHVLKVNLRILDEADGFAHLMGDISERMLAKTNWHTPAVQLRLAE